SVAQENAFIARRLRREHLRGGHPWSDLAVIVRGHAQLAGLRRHLRLAGIPVRAQAPEKPLREEPAVRPLMLALGIVTRTEAAPTSEEAVALLTSVLGGLDALGLRRLRRELRVRTPGAAASADLLVDALAPVEPLADLPP